eukprot:gene7949-8591_t
MSADTLTATSRHFYERTKSKVAISIIVSAAGLGALGFCAATGGLSASSNDQAKNSSGDSKDALEAQAAGYGFAAFAFILAFILLIAAAIYVSPLFCGSNNEKKIIRSPQEIDSGYSAYSENPPSPNPQV